MQETEIFQEKSSFLDNFYGCIIYRQCLTIFRTQNMLIFVCMYLVYWVLIETFEKNELGKKHAKYYKMYVTKPQTKTTVKRKCILYDALQLE